MLNNLTVLKIEASDARPTAIAKIVLFEILYCIETTGLCTASIALGGTVLQHHGNHFKYFQSNQGAMIGATAGALWYLTYLITRAFYLIKNNSNFSQDIHNLPWHVSVMLKLFALSIISGYAAAGSKLWQWGTPGPAAGALATGHAIISAGIEILLFIAICMMGNTEKEKDMSHSPISHTSKLRNTFEIDMTSQREPK